MYLSQNCTLFLLSHQGHSRPLTHSADFTRPGIWAGLWGAEMLGLMLCPDGLTEGVEELAAIGWQAENAEGFGRSGEPWKQHPT